MMACDFDVEVIIDRVELGLSPLVLNESTGYHLTRNGIGPGDKKFKRQTTESVFVSGRTLIHATPDIVDTAINLRVSGGTREQLFERIRNLADAISQFSYQMQVTVEGEVELWKCEPADFVVGEDGRYDDLMLRSNMQPFGMTVTYKPIL